MTRERCTNFIVSTDPAAGQQPQQLLLIALSSMGTSLLASTWLGLGTRVGSRLRVLGCQGSGSGFLGLGSGLGVWSGSGLGNDGVGAGVGAGVRTLIGSATTSATC